MGLIESCVFCRIASKELPAKIVYEDDKCLSFLDVNPVNPGHLLVIPKEHYKTITDMPVELYEHLSRVVWDMSLRIQRGIDPDGLNIVQNNNEQAGQEVPHFHIHLVPRFIGDEEQYKDWRTIKPTDEELSDMRDKLKNQN